MAKQEVERYTFRAPGQATSYFYGYLRWMQMKAETEMALGPKFDRQRYHDFMLGQGLLPPGSDRPRGARSSSCLRRSRARTEAQKPQERSGASLRR